MADEHSWKYVLLLDDMLTRRKKLKRKNVMPLLGRLLFYPYLVLITISVIGILAKIVIPLVAKIL